MISGCASIPEPLEGDYRQDLFPEQATEQSIGAAVRWGGSVVETRPMADETCIEILSRELGREGRPVDGDQDHGRFIACEQRFLDPEIFVNGREVTVVGRLDSFSTGSVGQFTYRYPVLDADSIYLWPERAESSYYGRGHYGVGYPYWPYYSPFYYRYYPPFFYPYSRGGFFHGSIHSTRSPRPGNSLSGRRK